MKFRKLPGVDPDVSVVVQGAMGLLNLSEADAFAVLDAALGEGINTFDTALVYAYDDASVDALLGRWIASHGNRSDVVLMAKGCHPMAPDWEASRVRPELVAKDVSATLERMQLDRLDVWSFHRDDPSVAVAELVEAANAEIARGAIGAWGVSNWTTDRIDQANTHAGSAGLAAPVANSAHFSLLDQVQPPWDNVETLTGHRNRDALEFHVHHNMAVVAWSALCGGMLSSHLSRTEIEGATDGHLSEVNRSYGSEENWQRRARAEELAASHGVTLSQIAIAWLLASELAPLAIVGGASPAEVSDTAIAVALDLPPAELQTLTETVTPR